MHLPTIHSFLLSQPLRNALRSSQRDDNAS